MGLLQKPNARLSDEFQEFVASGPKESVGFQEHTEARIGTGFEWSHGSGVSEHLLTQDC